MRQQNSTTYDAMQHQTLCQQQQATHRRKLAHAQGKKGLLLVITGNGKGKTSSAFGMAVRAVGHGMKVGIVQFIKSQQNTAETRVFAQFPNVIFKVIGDGFTWDTQNREHDIKTAECAWQTAVAMMADCDMLILDELNIVLHYQYLDLFRVLNVFAQRAAMQHIIVTGRHAPPALLAQADLVSTVESSKHPFEQGIQAQKGIEF
jgi:cob(I)alamin adenosyltransferase